MREAEEDCVRRSKKDVYWLLAPTPRRKQTESDLQKSIFPLPGPYNCRASRRTRGNRPPGVLRQWTRGCYNAAVHEEDPTGRVQPVQRAEDGDAQRGARDAGLGRVFEQRGQNVRSVRWEHAECYRASEDAETNRTRRVLRLHAAGEHFATSGYRVYWKVEFLEHCVEDCATAAEVESARGGDVRGVPESAERSTSQRTRESWPEVFYEEWR